MTIFPILKFFKDELVFKKFLIAQFLFGNFSKEMLMQNSLMHLSTDKNWPLLFSADQKFWPLLVFKWPHLRKSKGILDLAGAPSYVKKLVDVCCLLAAVVKSLVRCKALTFENVKEPSQYIPNKTNLINAGQVGCLRVNGVV